MPLCKHFYLIPCWESPKFGSAAVIRYVLSNSMLCQNTALAGATEHKSPKMITTVDEKSLSISLIFLLVFSLGQECPPGGQRQPSLCVFVTQPVLIKCASSLYSEHRTTGLGWYLNEGW